MYYKPHAKRGQSVHTPQGPPSSNKDLGARDRSGVQGSQPNGLRSKPKISSPTQAVMDSVKPDRINKIENAVNRIQKSVKNIGQVGPKGLISEKETLDKNKNRPPPQVRQIGQRINPKSKQVEDDLAQQMRRQLKAIRSQLSEIKSKMGLGHQGSPNRGGDSAHQGYPHSRGQENEDVMRLIGRGEEEQENIYSNQQQLNHNHNQPVTFHHIPNRPQSGNVPVAKPGTNNPTGLVMHAPLAPFPPKPLQPLSLMQPYLKEFKLEPAMSGPQPFYIGYHKKTSKRILVKYSENSIEPIIQTYILLWKNIVKSKYICINRLFEVNEPLAGNMIVLEWNPCGWMKEEGKDISESNVIAGSRIQNPNQSKQSDVVPANIHPITSLIVYLLHALRFIHSCGLLYRNIHPTHVMHNTSGQPVLIDFKCVRKYIDHKQKTVDVVRDSKEHIDEFASNNRVRGLIEGRKDDLESLGYLAVYFYEGRLPWTLDNMVQVRSKITLQQLCRDRRNLLEYMVLVHQCKSNEDPDYNHLEKVLLEQL